MRRRLHLFLWRGTRSGGWLWRLPLPSRIHVAINNWVYTRAPVGVWLPANHGKKMRRLGPGQWEMAARDAGGMLRLRED